MQTLQRSRYPSQISHELKIRKRNTNSNNAAMHEKSIVRSLWCWARPSTSTSSMTKKINLAAARSTRKEKELKLNSVIMSLI